MMSEEVTKQLSADHEKRLSALHKVLSSVETMVGHELSLVGNRMTWFAISQSFLFGAYATIATDPVRMKIFDAANTTREFGEFTTKLVLFFVPVVGALFAFAARRSVAAAGRVLDDLMTSRGSLINGINAILKECSVTEIPVIGDVDQRSKALKTTIRDGELPLWLLPWGMAVVWLTMLLIRLPWEDWIGRLGTP
jgi:hypothetical protein